MKSYIDHITSTSRSISKDINIKSQMKIDSRPVFRSSAIFPVFLNKQINVRLLFLGYWIIKKNIDIVSSVLTIRDKKGKPLFRRSMEIFEVKSYEIDLKKLLKKIINHKNFVGSAEIEFFSNTNLTFPYPAVTINFFSNSSSTFVHTTSRIYNDYDDKINNNKINVKESGFDLFLKNSSLPIISFVNGPNFINKKLLKFEFIDQNGHKISYCHSLKNLDPYKPIFLNLLFNSKIKNFLKSDSTLVKISHSFTDFYPRFLVLNINKKKDMTSLTHSYYDTSNLKDKYNFWKNPNKKIYSDAVLSVPLFKNYITELVIYPIMSLENSINLDLEIYNKKELIKKVKNFFVINKKIKKRVSFIVNNLINVPNKNDNFVAKISFNSSNVIPSRIKFGMNVKTNKNNIFPTNICFNARVANIYNDSKPSSFKWAPIINHKNSFFNISNISFRKKIKRDANLIIKFWREIDNKFIQKKIKINENSFYNFSLCENNKIQNFLKNKPGWVTIQSDNSNLDAWYFEDMSKGTIGGDHFF